jgi:hypothetical protein
MIVKASKLSQRWLRAAVVTGICVGTVATIVPWVDELMDLRSQRASLEALRTQWVQLQEQSQRIGIAAANTEARLAELQPRATSKEELATLREQLVELARQAGCQVRQVQAVASAARPWAVEGDDPTRSDFPEGAEESGFELQSQQVSLRVVGSLESVRTLVKQIQQQRWLGQTRNLTLQPDGVGSRFVSLEMQMNLFGLVRVAIDPASMDGSVEAPTGRQSSES